MTQEKKTNQPSLAILILGCIGGLLLQLIAGSLYQWGILSIYITSYFKKTDSSLTLEETSISTPLMMIALGLTMSFGLRLAKITHPLIVLTVSQVLQAVSIFISSYMKDFWTFQVFYGILFGLIAGVAFMIPMAQCNKYLPGKKMYINGVILMGSGLGSVVFGQFSYNFLNHSNVAPLNGYYLGSPELEDIAMQVPILMKWLALMYLAIGVLGIFMTTPIILKNRKAENEHEQKRIENQLAHQAKKHHVDSKPQQNKDQVNQVYIKDQHKQKQQKHLNKHQRRHLHEAHTITEAVKSRIFWLSNLMFFFGSAGIFLVTSNYKTFVKTTITDDEFLTLIGVIGGIANGCSRIFWNLLFSKTGFKTVILTVFTLSMIVFATIRFTVEIKGAYLFQIFILNCCLGGLLVATPTSLLSLYGHNTGSQIYGIYWETFSLTNIITWVYVSQLTHIIGFNNVIYICLFMVGLACPAVIFMKFQGPWKNDTTQLEYIVGRQIIKRDQERAEEQKREEEHKNSDDQIHGENQVNHAQDEKNEKISESTASHIPSFVDLKFSKRLSTPKKRMKTQDPNTNFTSLKIINEYDSPESGKKEKKEVQKYVELPNVESTNIIVDGKN